MNIWHWLTLGLVVVAIFNSIIVELRLMRLTKDVDKATKDIIKQVDILGTSIAPKAYNAKKESERFYYDQ